MQTPEPATPSDPATPSEPATPPQGQEEEQEDVTIEFHSINHLFEFIRNFEGDFLIFQGIPEEAFQQIEATRDALGLHLRLFRPRTPGSLFITIPHGPHESGHIELYLQIRDGILGMQTPLQIWKSSQATTFRRPDGGGGGGQEGDSGGYPLPETLPPVFPSLVIECGQNQTWNSLHEKMRSWFEISKHSVRIVILVKVNPQTRTIEIQKYTEGVSHVRPLLATSSAISAAIRHNTIRPFLRQEITITENADTNPATYNVTRSPLVLEFALFRRRLPRPDTIEHDLQITMAQLQTTAIYKKVWTSSTTINQINALNATFGILFTLNATWAFDRFGRRWLFIVGAVGMGVRMLCVSVVGLAIPTVDGTKSQPVDIAIVFLFFLFFFYEPTCGATTWIWTCQAFSTDVRAQAVGMCLQMQNIANPCSSSSLRSSRLLPIPFYTDSGLKCQFLFMSINIVLAVYVYFLIPEAKNVPLEETDVLFSGANHVDKGANVLGSARSKNHGATATEQERVPEVIICLMWVQLCGVLELRLICYSQLRLVFVVLAPYPYHISVF